MSDGGPLLARWAALSGPDARWLQAPASGPERRRLARELRAGPAGGQVVVFDGRLGARRRCRRLLREAGVTADRELVAIPSLRRPMYLVEDAPEALRWFCANVLTVPPGASGLLGLAVVVLRHSRWAWRRVLPSRVVVGIRA